MTNPNTPVPDDVTKAFELASLFRAIGGYFDAAALEQTPCRDVAELLEKMANELKRHRERNEGEAVPVGKLLMDRLHDLFNPSRLPERREDGYVWHPDSDLISELLGIDDEGEAYYLFIEALGYEFWTDSLDEYPIEDSPDCSSWEPERPNGDGWLLAWIAANEDGPFTTYVRKASPPSPSRELLEKDGYKLLKDSTYQERSWDEDADEYGIYEGSYSCACHYCQRNFTGHKRRSTCKVCALMLEEQES